MNKPTKPKKFKYLAQFERGAQDIFAADRDEAIRKGEAAARKLGKTLCDVFGPDEDEGTL